MSPSDKWSEQYIHLSQDVLFKLKLLVSPLPPPDPHRPPQCHAARSAHHQFQLDHSILTGLPPTNLPWSSIHMAASFLKSHLTFPIHSPVTPHWPNVKSKLLTWLLPISTSNLAKSNGNCALHSQPTQHLISSPNSPLTL